MTEKLVNKLWKEECRQVDERNALRQKHWKEECRQVDERNALRERHGDHIREGYPGYRGDKPYPGKYTVLHDYEMKKETT